MAILDIKTYPDPILACKAAPVENFDKTLRRLLDDMVDTMYDAPGVGLAAPQVGASLRAIVVDVGRQVEDSRLLKLVNPVIVHAEGRSVCEEGCLSVPGFTSEVVRPAKICLKAFDEQGHPLRIEDETFLATVLQHEIDHLDGILFIEHIGRLKRDLIRRKLKKKARQKSKLG
ncbi:peptide deformylase [candidate division KSB3 bacterium]|uniref:Peptide deformylase n=1 Tax=candidate division KSB3 bacterium TaxID=2044937 RepID=A0A2G6EA11_9BACT|nr:MAG: peptide deformylase [candidate division KSB3 bacterium]PIE29546.1 MAG: peptide deformylase [candidate division KSB3 bacterium]